MQAIKSLLEQVLLGSQKAYYDVCLILQTSEANWQFLDTIKFFCDFAIRHHEKLLNDCYGEALVDLTEYINHLPGLIKKIPEIKEFFTLLKFAAARNNTSAQIALMILEDNNIR